jgi:hypothetical protein
MELHNFTTNKRNTMNAFISLFASMIAGSLHGYDRVVFRGHLRQLSYAGGMRSYLWANQVLLRDFQTHVQGKTAELLQASLAEAERKKRPILYLPSSGTDKEALARKIMTEDRVRAGLIGVFKCVEPGFTYEVHGNRATKKLQLTGKQGRCLHVYHYYVHPTFGFMYARLQTWFPFAVQIGINGREWLARQMSAAGLKYQRRRNKFSWLEDFTKAQDFLDRQVQTDWPAALNAILQQIHPAHPQILGRMPLAYYWSVFQSEWASDYLFRRRADLERLYPQWLRHALLTYKSAEVMRFLGRTVPLSSQMNRNMTKTEVTTNLKKREEGVCLKHWVDGNSIKMYDALFADSANLRIETTINAPADFKVYRTKENDPAGPKDWRPMRMGVVDMPQRAEQSQAANERYAAALTVVQDKTALKEWSEPWCRRVQALGKTQRTERGLNPLAASDAALLAAVVDPKFAVTGLRNRDLVATLHEKPASDDKERRQRSAWVTRQIRMLRAHGILLKQEKSHRYHLNPDARLPILALLTARDANADELTKKAA